MGDKRRINVPKTTVRLTPNPDAEASNELLYGETVRVLENHSDWQKVQSEHDGYEGFVKQDDLRPFQHETTHVVKALWVHAYAAPDFKSRPVHILPFLARISVTDDPKQGYLPTSLGWIMENKIEKEEYFYRQMDWVETALRFLGSPYLWGGRTAQGIDCSALVQISLMAAGVSCPRDSDQQIELGEEVNRDQIQRGDLVFFDGHVGIMLDDDQILNATSRTMDTRIESLNDLEKIYDGIKAIKRL